MPALQIGKICYDWFTLCSHSEDFYSYWLHRQGETTGKTETWLKRFTGHVSSTEYGSIFLGSRREPVGFLHAVCVTGARADLCAPDVKQSLLDLDAWLTRVDIQATIPKDGFDIFGLVTRLEANGKKPELHGSHENGRTVYIGSRKSNRFGRLYEKFGDDRERYLRMEFQFQHESARSYGRSMATATITPGASFKGALQQTKDEKLIAKYESIISGFDPQLPRVIRCETNTDRWLMETVYPVLMRRLLAHDCPESLRDMYMRGIERGKR